MTIDLQDVAEPLEHLWQAQFGCYVHGVTGFDGAAVELEIVAERRPCGEMFVGAVSVCKSSNR